MDGNVVGNLNLEDECKLSFYRQIAALNEAHGVFLVQHQTDHKIYVKKVLSVFDASVYARLRTAPVPNTPRIYEVVRDEDQLIVIEEYIPGDTLQAWLDTKRPISQAEAVDVILQLCTILDALHSMEPPIVHRDVKPANVVVSPDGVVKLVDMNAAKWYRAGSGQDTALIGTVGYAAPEQYGFGASCVQTDIYGVGVLLNVLLTGVLPPERMATGGIGTIVAKCIRMEPGQRYPDIAAVMQALRRAKVTRAEPAPVVTSGYALPGFRHKGILKRTLAFLGYALVIAVGLNQTVTNGNVLSLWLNRIFLTGILFTIILLWGNYRGIQARIGLSRIANCFSRVILMLLLSFGIVFFGAAMLVLIESIVL